MSLPSCKETIEDMQTHSITSSSGCDQQLTDTSQGEIATVTFLWKESLGIQTVPKQIILIGTFDQVKLDWQDQDQVFKSLPTEIEFGIYRDCRLVVNGELYVTQLIVIDNISQMKHIQLQSGNTDLILKDQRQGKVAADQKGTESLLEISSDQSMFGTASNHTSSEVKEHFYGNCNEKSDWKGEDTKAEMRKQNERLQQEIESVQTRMQEQLRLFRDENAQTEKKLIQHARKLQELNMTCSKLETDIADKNKQFDLLQEDKLRLEYDLAGETALKEEQECRAESLEMEKNSLVAEIVKLESKLRTVQCELKQVEAQKMQDDELTDTITTLRKENQTLRAKCDEFEKAVSEVKNLTDQLKHKQEKLAVQARKAEDAENLAMSCKTEANKTISDLIGEKQTLEDCIKTGQDEQLSLQTQLKEAKSQKEVALHEMEGRLQGSAKEIESLKQGIADLKNERLASESRIATTSAEKRRLEKETNQLHRRLEEDQRKTAEKETLAQQLKSRLTIAEVKVLISDEELRTTKTELRKCREKLTTLEQENHSKRKLETSKAALEMKLQESESKRQAQENELKTRKQPLSICAYEEIRDCCRRYPTERNEARDELVKLGKLSKRPSSPMPTRKGAGLMDTNHKSQQMLKGSSATHVQRTRATDSEDWNMRDPTVLLPHDAKSRFVAPVTSSGNTNHVDGCSSRKHSL